MPIVPFLYEMFGLYLIAIIGYIARKKGLFTNQTDNMLTQVILYITLPALIIFSLDVQLSMRFLTDFIFLICLAILFLSFGAVLANIFARKSKLPLTQKGVYQSLILFGNQGFVGYSVTYILFAEIGVTYTAVFNLPFLLLIWTYGIYLFSSRGELSFRVAIMNPGLISTFIGVLLMFIPVTLPQVFRDPLEMVGMCTIPLSMLIIGSLIGRIKISSLRNLIKNKYIWISAFAKLLILPLTIIPITLYFALPFSLSAVAVLVAGMPSGPTTPLFAEKFGVDSTFGAFGVTFSTFLSILTLPMLYGILYFLYFLY